jgi:hypothetical protein
MSPTLDPRQTLVNCDQMNKLRRISHGTYNSGTRAPCRVAGRRARAQNLGVDEPGAPAAALGRSPGLAVAAVARRLGVAPATLRTWARRYGLGPSEHVAGSHRRYSAQDVARLELMRRMVNAGVGPGDAARAARAAAVDTVSTTPAATPPPLDDATRVGGGKVISLPGALPAARGLARAAMTLDGPACVDVLDDGLRRRGVIWTWDNLAAPVLVGVGRRWQATGTGIEVEHVVTESVVAAMSSVTMRERAAHNVRPVLLACADEEQHSLPLFTLAAALAERKVAARVLGARVPHEALMAAIRRTGPAVVLVWSRTEATGDIGRMQDLRWLRPPPRLLVAGSGWDGPVPRGAETVRDLSDAVTRICAVVR